MEHRVNRGHHQWRVRWRGYGASDDTWEGEQNLRGNRQWKAFEVERKRSEATRTCLVKGCLAQQTESRCAKHRELHRLGMVIKRLCTGPRTRQKQSKVNQAIAKQNNLKEDNSPRASSPIEACTFPYCNEPQKTGSKRCVYHVEDTRLRQRILRLRKAGQDTQELVQERQRLAEEHGRELVDGRNKLVWEPVSSQIYDTYNEALTEAQGRQPAPEFGVERGRHRTRAGEPVELSCRGSDCGMRLRVQYQGEGYVILKNGQHKDGCTSLRVSYPWSPEQLSVLSKEFEKGRSFSVHYYLEKLQEAELQFGCTLNDVRSKCHAERVKLGRWDEKGAPALEDLYAIVSKYSQDLDDWESSVQCVIFTPVSS